MELTLIIFPGLSDKNVYTKKKGDMTYLEKKLYGTVLIKASLILDTLSVHQECTLQSIAVHTNLTASTALKILETLTYIGYVDRTEKKTYRLGAKLIKFSNLTLTDNQLNKIVQPFLQELRDEIDETIHLGVLTGNEILYLNKMEPKNQRIMMSSKVGITRPLYSSAMGKAVLASFSEEQLQKYFQETSLIPWTEQTVVSKIKLTKQLQEVQKTKIAIDDEEMEKDIYCIGTTIDKLGKTIGAFSISIPKYRVTTPLLEHASCIILRTKKKIEEFV